MIKWIKRLSVWITLLVLFGCNTSNIDPNLPQMPYSAWKLTSTYPKYMSISVDKVVIITQDNKRYIAYTESIESSAIGKWSRSPGGVSGINMYMDLPKKIGVCWASFLDQKVYFSTFDISHEARQLMIEPYTKLTNPEINGYHTFYYHRVVMGLAPGGDVTIWLTGIADKGIQVIAKTQSREMIDDTFCKNNFPNGKITEISDEGKAWIKANGLPKEW